MFFIPSCCPGWLRISLCLSVPRTLRSVLTGSLEPLRGIRLVCYMYYTDVFVGTDNIEKLKNALEAELKGFNNSNALTQLVHGLCLFMGYPSCLCSLKANVDKSLKNISKKLLKDSEAVQSCVNLKPLNLNCSSCNSKKILCKCCVIQSIKAVKKCGCIKTGGSKDKCHCKDSDVSCAKVLSGLEACLHLQCLQSDMNEICECKADSECCKTGQCNGVSKVSCGFCQNLQTPKDYTVTGLGLLRPSPIRLAGRLEKFFGSSRKGSPPCGCKCGSGPSCCCLACDSSKNCSSPNSCFCSSSGQCSCASKLKPPKDCPCKTFCSKIKDVKVLANSSEMTCCSKGAQCHCSLTGSGSNCTPNCCVVEDKSGAGSDHYQHSVKCMLRRVVKFFASFDPSSKNCSKLCCEIFCVLKICEFLKGFYNKGNKNVCWTCKKGAQKNQCNGSTLTSGSSTSCCNGTAGCKSGNCCQGCQDCDAIKFSRALQKLQYSGPCGLDLYRLLKDLLNFCSNVMAPNQDFIHDTVLKAVKDCSKCKKSAENSSGWSACQCSSSSSSCKACPKLLENSKLMSILRHGYVSSYDSSSAKWEDLCQKLSSQCCVDPKTKSKNPSCSKCPCPSPSFPLTSSQSCDGSCCENCDVRKAAKIFLGMLPCLYYGLKILHDRSKYGSGFAGWHDITMDSKGLPSSDLAKFFYAWGYDLRPLKNKKGSEFFPLLDSLSTLKVLEKFSTLVTDKYFVPSRSPSPSTSDPSPPTTVRQMLLWLYGLRFQKHFSDIVENSKSLCSPFGNSFNSDAFC
ncbi:variant erythrocyte surface antigen-1, beta subunit, partial [Babesia divergens]